MIKSKRSISISGYSELNIYKFFTGCISLFTLLTITSCESKNTNKGDPSSSQKENVVNGNIQPTTDSGTSVTPSSAIEPNYNLLGGDWIRTDGGDTLILRDISPNGTLKASYFNPKEIHVGKSAWRLENNNMILMVQLQDINYPGSVYTLKYFQNEDQLAGNYFQAVEGANYDVVFTRK